MKASGGIAIAILTLVVLNGVKESGAAPTSRPVGVSTTGAPVGKDQPHPTTTPDGTHHAQSTYPPLSDDHQTFTSPKTAADVHHSTSKPSGRGFATHHPGSYPTPLKKLRESSGRSLRSKPIPKATRGTQRSKGTPTTTRLWRSTTSDFGSTTSSPSAENLHVKFNGKTSTTPNSLGRNSNSNALHTSKNPSGLVDHPSTITKPTSHPSSVGINTSRNSTTLKAATRPGSQPTSHIPSDHNRPSTPPPDSSETPMPRTTSSPEPDTIPTPPVQLQSEHASSKETMALDRPHGSLHEESLEVTELPVKSKPKQPFPLDEECGLTVPLKKYNVQKLVGNWTVVKLTRGAMRRWFQFYAKQNVKKDMETCFHIFHTIRTVENGTILNITMQERSTNGKGRSFNNAGNLVDQEASRSVWVMEWLNRERTVTSVVAAGDEGEETYGWLVAKNCDVAGTVKPDWTVMARAGKEKELDFASILAVVDSIKSLSSKDSINITAD